MIRNILIAFSLILILQGCMKENIKIISNNELQKFSKVELQTFELDTIKYLEIEGKNGTIIYYNRDDLKIGENEKVILELKEIYTFEELLFNNINTITENGELLESSGVLFLNFISKDKNIELKENSFVTIKLPKSMSEDDEIFSAKVDSLNQFNWKKEENRLLALFTQTRGRITIITTVPIDSLEYFQEREKEFQKKYESDSKAHKVVRDLFYAKLSWTNIDRLLKEVPQISFEINLKNNDIDHLTFYSLYENYNSFYSKYTASDKLTFNNIPYIENATWIVVIGNIGDKIYASKVKLSETINNIMDMTLEEKNEEELLQLMRN